VHAQKRKHGAEAAQEDGLVERLHARHAHGDRQDRIGQRQGEQYYAHGQLSHDEYERLCQSARILKPEEFRGIVEGGWSHHVIASQLELGKKRNPAVGGQDDSLRSIECYPNDMEYDHIMNPSTNHSGVRGTTEERNGIFSLAY